MIYNFVSCSITENCPDQNPRLKNWNPGHDREKKVIIKQGDLFRLNGDAAVHSIVIQDGGMSSSFMDLTCLVGKKDVTGNPCLYVCCIYI